MNVGVTFAYRAGEVHYWEGGNYQGVPSDYTTIEKECWQQGFDDAAEAEEAPEGVSDRIL